MTLLGWIFMLGSAAFVWGLTGWCFYKVLTAPVEPTEAQKEFHSA
jgi:hypothetical protein